MADLTPLTLISGLPGSGKTLFTLVTVDDYAKRVSRPVYYFGIPQLTLDWILMDDPKQWYTLPKGAIIVVDEAQINLFPARASGSPVPQCVSEANVLRHSGYTLVVITQHPMLIDNAIRKLVTCHYHVVRFYGFQKSTVHEFPQVRDNCDKTLKNSIANHFIYPPEAFNWYKSAELHTIKKRIPMRLILALVLPVALAGLIWFAFHVIGGIGKEKPISASGVSVSSAVSTGSVSAGHVLTQKEFFSSFSPRLAGFPATAPRYDEVTKPITAPVPRACVSSETKCICHSQQGTVMQVPDAVCRNIAINGFFVDFDIADKNFRNEAPTVAGGTGGGSALRPASGSVVQVSAN